MQAPREPFALELYRRFLRGETIQQLASELSIPPDRIKSRIQAAAAFRERHEQTTSAHCCRRTGGCPEPVESRR